MKLLTRGEYHATFTTKMTGVGPEEPPPFDFWGYVDAIPESHFEGHDCRAGEVKEAYRSAGGRYLHVLIASATAEVFLVLVLNCKDKVVYGHHLLDLAGELAQRRGGAEADCGHRPG